MGDDRKQASDYFGQGQGWKENRGACGIMEMLCNRDYGGNDECTFVKMQHILHLNCMHLTVCKLLLGFR